MSSMPLFAKVARRPIGVAAVAVAAMVMAPLISSPAQAAAAVTSGAPLAASTGSTYADAVLGDGASHLWRLGEASGTTAADSAGTDALTLNSSATRGVAGALPNETAAKATTFPGTATVPAANSTAVAGPQSFSLEAWIKTTSSAGGKIIGFGSSRTGLSGDYDRQIYMTNAGTLVFGVYPGYARTISSPRAYNDGQWHLIAAVLGTPGMELFVDGQRVARDTTITSAQSFSGYWRVGGDNLSGWPSQPTSAAFAGSIEEAAVYPTPLTVPQEQSHYQASGRTLVLPPNPTDAYGAAVMKADPSLYWRLDETSGSSALDIATNNPKSGTYSSGTVLGEPGAPAAPNGSSIRFPGTSAQSLISTVQVDDPEVYSLETWFKTTTTSGGRLIGFGDAASGASDSYDRQIYMLNSGQLRYGIYSGGVATIDSPASYNDGQWHQVVATQGSGGQQLFVDGALVSSGPAVTPQDYAGYWRLGSDSIWDGADGSDFAGSLDEAAVYPTVLSAATVQQHYQLAAPVNQAPTAAFAFSVNKLNASFDGSGSTDPDGTIASYGWQFGDGSTGTGASAKHTYAKSGTYTVVLTVTDNKGATGTASHTVTATANTAPTAAFTSTCTDLGCSFDAGASTDGDGTIASYAWDFGDNTSGTGVAAKHTYTAGGSYRVTLTVTDNDGATNALTQTVTVQAANNPPTAAATASCTDLTCSFDATGSSDSDGTIASYAWDFGDGSSGTGSQPSHTYSAAGTFTATVAVTDNRGGTGSASTVVTATAPNQPPSAAFSSDCTDLSCAFDAARSSDPDGSIVRYAWDFGDNANDTGVSPTHTYAAGTYTVKLTVTDDRGATDSVSHSVTAVPPNKPPVAAFTVSGSGLAASFDGSGSSDPDGKIVSYAWSFGDGTSGTGVSPSHTYTAGGAQKVTLTVTDDDGAATSIVRTVTVVDPNFAVDSFGRTVTGGLGSADMGGAWTYSGTGTTSAVSDGSAQITLPQSKLAVMTLSVTNQDTDLTNLVWLPTAPTGAGLYFGSSPRVTTAGQYRARGRILTTGAVTLQWVRSVGAIDNLVGGTVTVPNVTYTAGMKLRVRTQAEGVSPTTLRAKIWVDGTTEPAAWTLTTTDSNADMQVAGGVGLWAFDSASSSTQVVDFDSLSATMMTPVPVKVQ